MTFMNNENGTDPLGSAQENNGITRPPEGTSIPVTIGQTITPDQSPTPEVPAEPEIPAMPELPVDPAPTNTDPLQEQVVAPTVEAPVSPSFDQPIEQDRPAGDNLPPVVGGGGPAKSKLPFLIIGVVAFLIVASLGVYFGLVVPGKPENVYKSAMGRTGKVFKSTVDSYTNKEYLKKIEKTAANASFKYESKEINADGKVNLKADTKNAIFEAEVNSPLGKISSKANTSIPDNSEFPDVYFQVTGLKTISPFVGSPQLESLDGKWIEVNHTLFQQLVAQSSTPDEKYDPVKPEDISDLANKLSQPTVERVFGTDGKTAVFENKKFVGKETVDGKKTYHYTVKVNKANLKEYNKVITEAAYSSNLMKKINKGTKQEEVDQQKKDAIESTNKEIDGIGDDESFDAWVDKSSKLIYKIKVTDKENSKNILEIGQNYKKGDEIPMFVKITTEEEGSKSNTNIKITANKKTSNFKLEGSSDFSAGSESSGKLTYNLDVNPYTGEIKVEKPAGAIPITEVMKLFGVDPSMLAPSSATPVGARTDDTERQTDIKAIFGQLEAYYAQNGYYPTLQNLNDDNWVKTNMRGLDLEALKDPTGSSNDLVAVPAKNVYSYAASPAGCQNESCSGYNLVAVQSSGEQYAKSALD